MKWEQAHNSNGYHLLRIEAAWNEIESDYNDVVDEYSQVRLPGFRAGKIPRTAIERRFRREILKDFFQRAAQRLGREAVQEAGVESLGPVEATDIEYEKDKFFRFKISYLPMPEITLPDYGLLKTGDDGTDQRDRLSRRLLDLVQFDIPDEIVKAELLLDGTEDSDHSAEGWNAAAERIRLMLILKKIARTEGIEVDGADVERRIQKKADEFGTRPEILKAELEKGGGLRRLKDMLVAESTLEYLIERNSL